jgi:dienelactone hydrolase
MTTNETDGSGPTMTVTPGVGLIDEPLHIVVRRLPPGAAVTVRARLLDHQGVPWSAHAAYCVDGEGTIDLTRQAPVSGTYAGVDGEGLIASLAVEGSLPSRTFDSSSVAPLVVEFAAELGALRVARAQAHRLYMSAGVRATTLRDDGFSGTFFRPIADEARPGVVVLGGSSGKLVFAAQVAALLAGHGFPSLALGYFGLDGLPSDLIEIPLSYFKTAMDWLSSQPGVKPGALGVVGRSRGAELALLLGSRFPAIRSVVAYCPSSIVWNGLRGDQPVDVSAWREPDRPLPFLSLLGPELSDLRSRVFRTAPVALSPLFEAALDGPVPLETIIPVEKTNGPILLISGDDDRMWPSARMGEQIVERLEDHGHPFRSRHHRYPRAGHLMRTPGVSTSVLHNTFAFGGCGSAQAAANREAWAETLAFLHSSLGLSPRTGEPAIGAQR